MQKDDLLMNDFTKEELEAISDELEGTLYHQLRQKIQTMIDNYHEICKHLSTNFDDGIQYCNDCGYCVL